MDNTESELIFSKEGMLVRSKMNLPLVGEDWVEKKIPYEKAFTNKLMELAVTSIEPKIENGILKEIKLKLFDIKEKTSIMEKPFSTVMDIKNDESVKVVKSIRRITRDSIKRILPNGTKVRFDKHGVTYETKIDGENGEEDTLNKLVSDVCRTPKGTKGFLNVWRDVNARFLDNTGWHNLNDLRA